LAELYDACANRVHHYLVVRLGSSADADDVLQETFVRLSRLRRNLADKDNLFAYVFTIARHEAGRFATRRAHEARRAPTAEMLFCEAPGDRLAAREAAETLAVALAQLPAELREVVELKTYAALTLAEIAAVTSSPLGTVATPRGRGHNAAVADGVTC
jgi:RNA polymerase sigma-70 factor (ECF subfamily)